MRARRSRCAARLGPALGLALGVLATAASAFGDDAQYVGEAACRACHPVAAEHWAATIHGRRFLETPRGALEARACEACHGPGSRHMADPAAKDAIVAFTRESGASVESQNGRCLACHADARRSRWRGSVHERSDLGCSDCHNPMAQMSERGLLRTADPNDACFRCHPRQRTDFRKRSHMPLLEGKISCVDCHDPHGSSTPVLLRADSVNQLCYRCHAEKRGPFLWEHAPVADSCLNCHEPHGSSRLFLLTRSPPALCQECHVQTSILGHVTPLLTRDETALGGRPDERLMNRGCVNCHAQIHGSNHPSGARFHR